MSGCSKHKSRTSDHLSSKNKKKKSTKHSTSVSRDSVIETANRHADVKDKRAKSQERKPKRSSSTCNSSDSFIGRIKPDLRLHQLRRERSEFQRNRASYRPNNAKPVSLQRSDQSSAQSSNKCSKDRPNNIHPNDKVPVIKHQVRSALMEVRERGRTRVKEHMDSMTLNKKLNKSHKRRKSSTCSSSSSDSTSSRNSSSTSSSSSSSRSSSYKRRKKRKKKKLAKKMKRAEKKREERRKLKKTKDKIIESVNEMKQNVAEFAQDRLLSDISLELADRAKIMAPMTREEWEKKQSVIRRVYDGETGRHRLIKGDGEVLEEIVSRNRHIEINRQATKGDGAFFNARLGINR